MLVYTQYTPYTAPSDTRNPWPFCRNLARFGSPFFPFPATIAFTVFAIPSSLADKAVLFPLYHLVHKKVSKVLRQGQKRPRKVWDG